MAKKAPMGISPFSMMATPTTSFIVVERLLRRTEELQ
jgi:hypothetical protein